jgi:hypothetical protein
MMFIALSRIMLPQHMHIVPGKTGFSNGRSYGGNAPGEFDMDTVLGYFEGSPFAHEAKQAINRAIERGGAMALHGAPVILGERPSEIILTSPVTGRKRKLQAETRAEKKTEGDDLTIGDGRLSSSVPEPEPLHA